MKFIESSIAARQTLIVCETDGLPMDLTIEHAICLHDKLSLEYGIPLQRAGKLRCISGILDRLRQWRFLAAKRRAALSISSPACLRCLCCLS
ncbi:MAG TPA: hypothetical protein PK820_03370 [Candidatus Competibacteraceae bacterium]|nr:hypothetical protein [Candidatus Competibacteraceae bacterium]